MSSPKPRLENCLQVDVMVNFHFPINACPPDNMPARRSHDEADVHAWRLCITDWPQCWDALYHDTARRRVLRCGCSMHAAVTSTRVWTLNDLCRLQPQTLAAACMQRLHWQAWARHRAAPLRMRAPEPRAWQYMIMINTAFSYHDISVL